MGEVLLAALASASSPGEVLGGKRARVGLPLALYETEDVRWFRPSKTKGCTEGGWFVDDDVSMPAVGAGLRSLESFDIVGERGSRVVRVVL